MSKAIKVFDVEEGSIIRGRYRITVKFRGKVVDTFTKPTMWAAISAYESAGYQPIAWTEGRRIVCQKEVKN